jgi:hypothetical protein
MRTLIAAGLALALLTTTTGCGKEEPIPTMDPASKRGGMRPGGKVTGPTAGPEQPAEPKK